MNKLMTDDPTPKSKVPVRLILAGVAGIGTLIAIKMFVRPFDVPEFQDIDTSESAFVIPLEGDASKQMMFPSVDFLSDQKVAAKRIQIPHRWQQTGFLPSNGHYVPMIRLVKVDRRPVTREWTKGSTTGTSTKDEAVIAESKDSINFSIGVTCTGSVPEELAATFLYTYPSKAIADVMDGEIRARVQQVVAEEAARYAFTEMLGKKVEIMNAVRQDVVPYFEKRGIKVTTLGMLGGLLFENPEIQKAIDNAVKASQDKVVAEAKRDAQEVENRRMKMEAIAQAENESLRAESQAKLKRLLAVAEVEATAAKAKAEAQAKKEVAQLEAEAESIRSEAQSAARVKIAEAEGAILKKQAEARLFEAERAVEGSVGDVLVRLRQLDLETARWKQWDGKLPNMPWNGMTSLAAPYGAMVFPQWSGEAPKPETRAQK